MPSCRQCVAIRLILKTPYLDREAPRDAIRDYHDAAPEHDAILRTINDIRNRGTLIMAHVTADIRNIALVGHASAGKTLLAEALLAGAGAIAAKGSLDRGTTVCDFDSQEKKLLHSLDSALCHL